MCIRDSNRSSSTGYLQPLNPSTGGCIAYGPTASCKIVRGIGAAMSIASTSDGQNVYVAGKGWYDRPVDREGSSVAVFTRVK